MEENKENEVNMQEFDNIKKVDMEAQFTASKGKAFGLSLLICLGGAFLTGVLYYLGWFSSYIPMLTLIFAIRVFAKNCSGMSWKMFILMSAIVIVFNMTAIYLIAIFEVMIALKVSFITAVYAISVTPEVVAILVENLTMCFIFSMIGVAVSAVSLKKRA